MAIKNKYGLLVSYSCEELINDISEDIVLFGEDYRVYEFYNILVLLTER